MQIASTSRVLLAFIVAPLVTVLALTGALSALLLITGTRLPSLAQAEHASFFFAMFGLPVAYAVTLVVGGPLFLLWRRRSDLRRRSVIAVTVLLGAITMPVVWHYVWGDALDWSIVLVGAFMGLAAGATFATIALRRSRHDEQPSNVA